MTRSANYSSIRAPSGAGYSFLYTSEKRRATASPTPQYITWTLHGSELKAPYAVAVTLLKTEYPPWIVPPTFAHTCVLASFCARLWPLTYSYALKCAKSCALFLAGSAPPPAIRPPHGAYSQGGRTSWSGKCVLRPFGKSFWTFFSLVWSAERKILAACFFCRVSRPPPSCKSNQVGLSTGKGHLRKSSCRFRLSYYYSFLYFLSTSDCFN